MKKGFSLIALAVIVIITLILATTVTIAANSTINNSKKIAFGSEIKLVQESVDGYRARNDGNFPISETILFDFESLQNDSSKKQFIDNGEIVTNGKIALYQIDYDACSLKSLKYGNGLIGENDIYAVSINTGKVYYVIGIKIGESTYFTLTDEIKNAMNMGWTKTEKDGIIFEPSTTEWSANPLDMRVKVPKSYIVIDIKNSDNQMLLKNDNLSAMDDNYDIYQITMTEAKNYSVQVTYKITNNSKQKTAVYNVQNVDVTSPTIGGVNVTNTSNSVTLETLAQDTGSGIDKYYFSKDGISYYESTTNKFTFENLKENTNYSSFSVKVKDKVGNIGTRTSISATTGNIGDISIVGEFEVGATTTQVEVIFNPSVSNTERYYKINNGDWKKVSSMSEKFYIEEDSIIYAKIVDNSGQKKEISKTIHKKE